jgi:hypothetical protein
MYCAPRQKSEKQVELPKNGLPKNDDPTDDQRRSSPTVVDAVSADIDSIILSNVHSAAGLPSIHPDRIPQSTGGGQSVGIRGKGVIEGVVKSSVAIVMLDTTYSTHQHNADGDFRWPACVPTVPIWTLAVGHRHRHTRCAPSTQRHVSFSGVAAWRQNHLIRIVSRTYGVYGGLKYRVYPFR